MAFRFSPRNSPKRTRRAPHKNSAKPGFEPSPRWRLAPRSCSWRCLRSCFPGISRAAMRAIWVQAILSSIVILVLGWEFHQGMARLAVRGTANMDTLISLGTLSALAFSFWALLAGDQHLYFETGAVIAALILLGRYFEARSRGQASAAIEKLIDLGAKTARLVRDGVEKEVPDRLCSGRRHPPGQARGENSRSMAVSSMAGRPSMRRC